MNGTCRIYMAEEVGIIRNVIDDLAYGSADGPIAVGRLLREHGYSTVSGAASRSEVGVDRGLGE